MLPRNNHTTLFFKRLRYKNVRSQGGCVETDSITDFVIVRINHSEVINNEVQSKQFQGQHFFPRKKRATLGGTRTHDTLQSRKSVLPTELPGQTSRQGPKSTIQYNAKASKPQITPCGTQEFRT